jgi:6-pyruvoyl-tetrahydropterin synthase
MSNKNSSFAVNEILVEHCIFDIIDYKINEIDVSFLMNEFQQQFPAQYNILNVLKYLCVDSDFKVLTKVKNEIKYLSKENKICKDTIENFSKILCNYIFESLKPIIHEKCVSLNDNEISDDKTFDTSNTILKNFMLLKDQAKVLEFVKRLIHDHF